MGIYAPKAERTIVNKQVLPTLPKRKLDHCKQLKVATLARRLILLITKPRLPWLPILIAFKNSKLLVLFWLIMKSFLGFYFAFVVI